MKIIELNNVSKRFRYQKVFENFSFFVNKGECILLVGANGSGKSTLIRGILGLIGFDSGLVRIRSDKISYVPERFSFPEFVTLKAFLKVLLLDFNDLELYHILDEWGLLCDSNKDLGTFSKGMKQKVLLIQAIHSDSDILLFDEPLSGLDNLSETRLIRKLEVLKSNGKTILIASHNPNKFGNLPDRIIKLEGGDL
jgi:ABC-type multidrug transport system ATPase subunit